MNFVRIKYKDEVYEFSYPTLFDYYLFLDGQKVRVFDRLARRIYSLSPYKKALLITILFEHFPAFAVEDKVFSNIPESDLNGWLILVRVFGYKPHEILQLNPYELDFAVRLAEYMSKMEGYDSNPQE